MDFGVLVAYFVVCLWTLESRVKSRRVIEESTKHILPIRIEGFDDTNDDRVPCQDRVFVLDQRIKGKRGAIKGLCGQQKQGGQEGTTETISEH